MPFNIKYESGDASVHYLTSVMFSKQDTLLSVSYDEVYGSFQGRKIGSYTNTGIIMKAVSNIVNETSYYNIFIAFGIFILFMTGAMMYNTLEKFTKNKYGKLIALCISLIFIMGYPLNSFFFGFEYLSLGILVICTIIHMIYYFEEEKLKNIYILIVFALLNFGIFCSYYLFVPFVYSALWIYFCAYSYKNNKKIFCKNNIIILTTTLLIPFFLGFIYHLMPNIYNIFNLEGLESLKNSLAYSSNILNNSFKLDGYIYTNYYSNMLPLIPLMIYYIIQKIKKKEIFSFDIILLIFLIGYMLLLFIGLKLELVSSYFLMKNYFALWIVLMYMNFKSLVIIYEKKQILAYTILESYLFVITINLLFIDMPLNHNNVNENIANIAEIFGVNKTLILKRKEDLNINEIEVLKYAKENLNFKENEIEVLADDEQVYWAYSILRYINYEEDVEILRSRIWRTRKIIYKIFKKSRKNRKSGLYNILYKSRIL